MRPYAGPVPLIKRIQKVTFEPYKDHRSTRAFEREYGFTDYAADKNLTLQVTVTGYPAMSSPSSWKTEPRLQQHGEGTWQLSQASFESQKSLPLELELRVNSADLRGGFTKEPIGVKLWLFHGWVYFTDNQEDFDAEDVRALINVEENKRRLTLEKAHALQAMTDNYDKPKRRESIPQAARVEVWQRDGGHCVECNSQEKLEFDHIIPVAMGGANTSRNLQLLCETCNRRKGASLG